MDPIIIAAIVTTFGGLITTVVIKGVKKRKTKTDSISYTRTIEQSSAIKIASEKYIVPVSLIKDSKIFKQRIQNFDEKFRIALENSEFEAVPPMHEIPELFASYSNAKTKYAQWGEKVDINLIIKVLIERLKAFNQKDEIYYDQALINLGLITSSQLKLLVFHQITYGLYQFLENQSPEMLPDIKNLLHYLRNDFDVTSADIEHLISQGLINDLSPKRYPEILNRAESDSKILELRILIEDLLLRLLKLQIWSYNLSPICRIITSLKIKALLDDTNVGFIYPKTEFADLYVKNLIATAEVTAFATNPEEKKKE